MLSTWLTLSGATRCEAAALCALVCRIKPEGFRSVLAMPHTGAHDSLQHEDCLPRPARERRQSFQKYRSLVDPYSDHCSSLSYGRLCSPLRRLQEEEEALHSGMETGRANQFSRTRLAGFAHPNQ